jgi:cytochrome P450
MRQIGLQLVREKQQSVLEEKASGGGTFLEKGKDKDLLSLLIKANMDKDIPPEQRLTIEQILNQIPTFLVAGEPPTFTFVFSNVNRRPDEPLLRGQGHETTSTETTWTLYALARHPHIQTKLREELAAFPHDAPSMDDLNALHYLDAVVRETLRLYAAVDGTVRTATQADVIPLAKPFMGRDGVLHSEIQ